MHGLSNAMIHLDGVIPEPGLIGVVAVGGLALRRLVLRRLAR
ncbi:MAG: hypothetical protein N2595_02160 [bacterium]|nr:hypothetical protein [bacterium]